jgi:HAD superfamily hydrolase (TIGR01509 family)
MAEKMDKAGVEPRRKSALNQSITAEGVSSRMAALKLKPLTPSSPAVTPTGGSPPKSPTVSLTDSGVSVSMDKKKDDTTSADVDENVFEDDESIHTDDSDIEIDTSDLTDKSVRILPGVRRFIDSLPEGRYCVATSGAKTYCYGALKRVGIVPPKVTITADDPRLKNGKPFPDPFLLAAKELGFDPKKCVVVEDSPSGIKAGVASGAKTIAVCTSHPHEKISHCGAHWLIPTLDLLQTSVLPNGRIKIKIDASYEEVLAAHRDAVKSSAPPQLYLEQKEQLDKEAQEATQAGLAA